MRMPILTLTEICLCLCVGCATNASADPSKARGVAAAAIGIGSQHVESPAPAPAPLPAPGKIRPAVFQITSEADRQVTQEVSLSTAGVCGPEGCVSKAQPARSVLRRVYKRQPVRRFVASRRFGGRLFRRWR
jgi:hypothetical protein